jgi:hypothetical protein
MAAVVFVARWFLRLEKRRHDEALARTDALYQRLLAERDARLADRDRRIADLTAEVEDLRRRLSRSRKRDDGGGRTP